MGVIELSALDLGLSAMIIVALAVTSLVLSLGLEKKIVLYSARMTAQLLLIGLVLRYLFGNASGFLVCLMSLIMLAAAGREVQARQKRKVQGWSGYFIATSSMFVSSFSIALIALVLIIQVKPWYTPQYAVPILGMLLGNTMTGVALAIDLLVSQLYEKQNIVEQRLMMGQSWKDASSDISRDAMRNGMMPIINSMAAAGLVSLPGMMTGQILGGSPPVEAVKYQILIMFLISAGTGFGVITAIRLTARRLFDKRHRLRLELITSP